MITRFPAGLGLGLRGAFLERIEAGEAEGRIAFVEVAPENYMRRGGTWPRRLAAIAERLPVVTHGLTLSLGGLDPFDDEVMRTLRGFLARYGAPWHSDHLCWSAHSGTVLHDLLPLACTRATVRRVVERIREAQDRLDRPLAIENISAYARLGHATMREPEMLVEILERADCGLLLDVNNVFVNARNHGFDPYAWLAEIPLERVVQLHVAGHEPGEGGLVIDTHGAEVRPEVADLLAWVIERTGPKPVVLERDANIPPLSVLLSEVDALERVYRGALERHALARGSVRAHDGPVRVDALRSHDEDEPPSAHVHDDAPLGAMAALLRTARPPANDQDFAASLHGHGVDEADAAAMIDVGLARFLVYRKLVHDRLRRTVRAFIPRTAARLEPERIAADVAAFVAACGPVTPYLRDVPRAFVEWVAPRWRDDAAVPDALVDLAAHELLEQDVRNDPRGGESSTGRPLALDRPVAFEGTARLCRYRYAVHRWRDVDRDEPEAVPTCLLVYRDDHLCPRYLELTPFAERIMSALLEHGMELATGLRHACEHLEEPLDDEHLAAAATLLADLAERGIVLGAIP